MIISLVLIRSFNQLPAVRSWSAEVFANCHCDIYHRQLFIITLSQIQRFIRMMEFNISWGSYRLLSSSQSTNSIFSTLRNPAFHQYPAEQCLYSDQRFSHCYSWRHLDLIFHACYRDFSYEAICTDSWSTYVDKPWTRSYSMHWSVRYVFMVAP